MTFMFHAQTSEFVGFWNIFMGHLPLLSSVLLYWSRAIWLCEAGMLPQCPDPHPVVTVLVFLAGN